MKTIVFGATGQIGRLAVENLLADGHTVTAFARHPEALGLDHPALRLQAGDALNPEDVSQAIAGQEAVVVTLGAGAARKSKIRSEGTRNVIAAMQAHGVRRLVCQSTLGAHESWANLNFYWKRIMFGLLLRPVHRDHELQEVLVRESGLDWTIVRPSAFADGPATGRFRVGFGPSEQGLALKISRADVADFLRRQVAGREDFGRAVAISN
ncbi:MAG: SDR family oxidoreductase [Maritimibacter sp.]|nr:SDR family oxidoreductase [Maritimibacter sp.]